MRAPKTSLNIGEGSQISTNQKRGNSAFSLLIGLNVRSFPENIVLYYMIYVLQVLWCTLEDWYGCDTAICRRARLTPNGNVILELFPLKLNFYKYDIILFCLYRMYCSMLQYFREKSQIFSTKLPRDGVSQYRLIVNNF